MAFMLAGGLVATYLVSSISDAWDSATKPIYDYIDAKKKESEDYTAEQMRQGRISHRKELLEKNNKTRAQYHIAEKNVTELINDTGSQCSVMFVNHEQANNITDAMKCLEPALTTVLAPNESVKLIQLEFEEYFIFLSMHGDVIVLTQDKFGKETISVQSLVTMKHIDNAVDMECKWF